MSIAEQTLLEKLTERIGTPIDKELKPSELAYETGVSVETWKSRRLDNLIWAEAFYPVGGKDFRTTLRRIYAAQDKLARVGMQHMKKAA